MIKLQYLTMDTNSWIDTGIKANPQSVFYAKLSPQSVAASIDWATFWGANSRDDASDTYQLRQAGMPTGGTGHWKPQIGTTWWGGEVGTMAYGDDYEITFDVPNSLVTINNDTYTGGQCSWGTPENNPTYAIYVGANNKANSGYRASGAKWYAFNIIQSGVKVIDLIPAIDENNVVCFYDKVSGNYFYNAGTGVFTAGPFLSSIVAEASKTTLPSTGETIDIDVTCSNSWTVAQTGNWLTLSAAGGTGNTTITATAPSYTGSDDRTTTLTFTDTTTSDTAELVIKQKKYTDGQPVYLGANEITEAYLGDVEITEAYLGDVLVFSASAPAPTPTPGGDITITIDGADACIGGDPVMGDCLDVSAYTYSIVSVDPNDGETEFETFASATIENAMYGEGIRFEITDSATTSGITSITLDDSDGIKLTIVGEFDTANTYAVKCSTVGIDDGITRYGYAMGGNSNNYFNLSEDISVTPDFSYELMPLRTLTIEGVPAVPNDATHIEVSDDDKFSIDISWNGSDVDTYVSTADEGSGDRITVNYVSEEEAIIIEADWDAYNGEGSGEYTIKMKAETDSCTVEEGNEGTYSLQWQANELTKTITFDGGTCTPSE